ncbi:MAG: hypothetical protein FJ098_12770 [Deltaproteobacteria bacterium]|nr:hypothetical protein [Deltaproteobacteria bacterium]
MTLTSLLSHLPGFTLHEVMTGTHEFLPGRGPEGSHPFEFRVRWGTADPARFLDPRGGAFLVNDLEGTVTAGGLCTDAACRGTLELRYLRDRTIRYGFTFHAGGSTFRYRGEKVNILPWNLPFSHTTCFGTLTDGDGRLVSRSVTFFRLRTVPAFLASLRAA